MAVWIPSDPGGLAEHWLVDLKAETVTFAGPAAQQDSDWDVVGSADAWEQVLAGRLNLSVALRSCQLRYCDGAESQWPASDQRIRLLAAMLGIAAWTGRLHRSASRSCRGLGKRACRSPRLTSPRDPPCRRPGRRDPQAARRSSCSATRSPARTCSLRRCQLSRSLACTSGTGLIPLCHAALATWQQADDRSGPPSALAIKSVRALAGAMMVAIQARTGAVRWCETALAQPAAADSFLQVFPSTAFVCVHRDLPGVRGRRPGRPPVGPGQQPVLAPLGPLPRQQRGSHRRLVGSRGPVPPRLRGPPPLSCTRVHHDHIAADPGASPPPASPRACASTPATPQLARAPARPHRSAAIMPAAAGHRARSPPRPAAPGQLIPPELLGPRSSASRPSSATTSSPPPPRPPRHPRRSDPGNRADSKATLNSQVIPRKESHMKRVRVLAAALFAWPSASAPDHAQSRMAGDRRGQFYSAAQLTRRELTHEEGPVRDWCSRRPGGRCQPSPW